MKELSCPKWLHDAHWLRNRRGLKVAACESRGENAIDLMLAVYLATLDHDISLDLTCYDDHRDPKMATALAQGLAIDGTQVVIGHFAAPTAMSAGRIYDHHPMLFLAPGCSDPELCSGTGPGAHAVRFFGSDDEQADCLLAAVPAGARVSIFAQRGNYGQRLGKVLHQRLSAHASAATIEFLNADGGQRRTKVVNSDLIVVAGSCEFAKQIAEDLPLSGGQTLLFSDDCRMGVAVKLQLPARKLVAALECDLESPTYTHFAQLEKRAMDLAGRPPGPYFLTSYLACQALCIALREVPNALPSLLRNAILGQRIPSPYGVLSFDEAGNQLGHKWILKTVPPHVCNAQTDGGVCAITL
ncbi:hypothetical protein L861_24075 [Litchfieldella anticariensis FP35 = DSM 16096]|uniref:Leucine-binding protein domain-containing protein n=1 Tax=Litchfieldella anticariensis (strain DSM 16096 / CECT 5854 / CIP 108499 / LMG 22089 / FP35) TaxID=1121939 RepID=S2KLU2_LITA3|nr:hypothetical protein [Halomonas anticariensis]EPC02890.1 hypothetical protein L861_24075 [Halomonas anticariensis FP35 = DSM 16096]